MPTIIGPQRLVPATIRYATGTLYMAHPLDDLRAYPTPRPGSVLVRTAHGETDGWHAGVDHCLEGWATHIPPKTQVIHGATITGWEWADGFGTACWRDFLERALDGLDFWWTPGVVVPGAPDGGACLCELLNPANGELPEPDDDMLRRVFLRIRSLDRLPFLGY